MIVESGAGGLPRMSGCSVCGILVPYPATRCSRHTPIDDAPEPVYTDPEDVFAASPALEWLRSRPEYMQTPSTASGAEERRT